MSLSANVSEKAALISQKTTVMLEHFHSVTMHKIGGKAEATLSMAAENSSLYGKNNDMEKNN